MIWALQLAEKVGVVKGTAFRPYIEPDNLSAFRPRGHVSCPATNLRVPHPPDFMSGLVGVGELHAAFLRESRTSGHGWGCVTGNPGPSRFLRRVGSKNLDTNVRVSHPLQRTQRMGHPEIHGASCFAKHESRTCFFSSKSLHQSLFPSGNIHLPDDRLFTSSLEKLAPGSAVSYIRSHA
jgi:hypothetical protein